MYLNIQCLISQSSKAKVVFLDEFCSQNDIKVIALTETWLRPAVFDSEIQIPNFCLIRGDRVNPKNPLFPHGGVALYLHNSFVVSNSFIYSNGVCDCSFVSFGVASTEISLSVCYRPPVCSPADLAAALKFLNECRSTCPESPHFLFGDFNFPKIMWHSSEMGAVAETLENNDSIETLMNFSLTSFLT